MSNSEYLPQPSEAGAASANLRKGKRQRSSPDARALQSGDRLPPHSPESEQGVLGCVFLSPHEVMSVCLEAGVKADWFYDLRHQVIWACFAEMYDGGKALDVITVQQKLKDQQQLESVGGIAYLATLPDTVPSAANLSFYLKIVREKDVLRRMIRNCIDTVDRIYTHEGEIDPIIEEHQMRALALTEERGGSAEIHIKPLVLENINRLEDYHRGAAQTTGLLTGLPYVDKMTGGLGGENGNDIVVGARPGLGKTSLGLDFTCYAALDSVSYTALSLEALAQQLGDKVVNAALVGEQVLPEKFVFSKDRTTAFEKHKGIPTAFFTLEMSALRLVRRMMFQRSLSDLQRFRTGFAQGEDFVKLAGAAKELARAQIWIDPTKRLTIEMLKARVRRMFRQYGIRLFVLDYLQLMKSDRRHYKPADRVQEMEDISGEIAALGNELNVPILSLAQLNRDSEKEPNRPPRLSDLKSAGAIEQDADVVMLLYRPTYKKDDPRAEFWDEARAKVFGGRNERDWSAAPQRVNLMVEKNRDGLTGPCELIFHRSSTHFEDYNEWLKRHGLKAPAAGEKRLDLPSEEEFDRG